MPQCQRTFYVLKLNEENTGIKCLLAVIFTYISWGTCCSSTGDHSSSLPWQRDVAHSSYLPWQGDVAHVQSFYTDGHHLSHSYWWYLHNLYIVLQWLNFNELVTYFPTIFLNHLAACQLFAHYKKQVCLASISMSLFKLKGISYKQFSIFHFFFFFFFTENNLLTYMKSN